jgi:ligand-binding sensor domain-containing protein
MKRYILIPLIICVTLICATISARAQEQLQTDRGRQFHMEHYSNTKWDPLVADGGRYIWTASSGGLVRFDKQTHADTVFWRIDSVPDSFINDMKVDRNGVLWLATADGLFSYDGQAWSKTTFQTRSDTDASYAIKIALDSSGGVWVMTTTYSIVSSNTQYLLHHLAGNAWTHFEESDGIVYPEDFNVTLMATKDGSLWMGEGQGTTDSGRFGWGYVTRISPNGQLQSWFKEDGLPYQNSASIRAMAIDSSGGVWAVSGWALSRFDGTIWTYIEPSYADTGYENPGAAIVVDKQGIVWAGSMASRFDGTHWTSYNPRTNFNYPVPRGYVNSFEIGTSGDVWAATDSGVSRFQGGAWTNYNNTNGISCDTVISMVRDQSGEIILGTAYGLDRMAEETGWQQYLISNEPLANTAIAMAVDWKQNLWIIWGYGIDASAAHSVLGRFDGITWEVLDTTTGVPFSDINDISVDNKGLVWIAGQGGIASYDGSAWKSYAITDSLTTWREYCHIGCDSSGNIWSSSFTLQPLPPNPAYPNINFANSFVQIHKFDGSNWKTWYYDENHLTLSIPASGGIREVATARDGGVYFAGSENEFGEVPIYKITNIGVVTYAVEKDTIKGFDITGAISPNTIACDSDNSVWAGMSSGTQPGFIHLQDGQVTRILDSEFTSSNAYAPPHSIVVDSNDTKWLGTFPIGILGYNNGQWDHIGFENGLPCNDFSLSAIAPNQDLWYEFGAYYYGGGFIKIDWGNSASSGVAQQNQPLAFVPSVYPNPFHTSTNISYSLAEGGYVTISLFNSAGVCVASLASENEAAGEHTLAIPDLGLPSGSYRAEINATNGEGKITRSCINLSLIW